MGLDCSHGAFNGAYSAFNRLRQAVCFVMGGSFPPHYQYNADFSVVVSDDFPQIAQYRTDLDHANIYFGRDLENDSGLFVFLQHSDCGGEISPEMCVRVADELEVLLPKIDMLTKSSGGHIEAQGGYGAVLRKFIKGCRRAASDHEPLLFGE